MRKPTTKTTTATNDELAIAGPCRVCGVTCSTHPDACNPLAFCGDCGGATCPEHRTSDRTQRCTVCAERATARMIANDAELEGRADLAAAIRAKHGITETPAKKKPAKKKPTPTSLNVWSLAELVRDNGGAREFPNRVHSTSAPHIRRCLQAEAPLVEATKTTLRLTDAGVDAVVRSMQADLRSYGHDETEPRRIARRDALRTAIAALTEGAS